MALVFNYIINSFTHERLHLIVTYLHIKVVIKKIVRVEYGVSF